MDLKLQLPLSFVCLKLQLTSMSVQNFTVQVVTGKELFYTMQRQAIELVVDNTVSNMDGAVKNTFSIWLQVISVQSAASSWAPNSHIQDLTKCEILSQSPPSIPESREVQTESVFCSQKHLFPVVFWCYCALPMQLGRLAFLEVEIETLNTLS